MSFGWRRISEREGVALLDMSQGSWTDDLSEAAAPALHVSVGRSCLLLTSGWVVHGRGAWQALETFSGEAPDADKDPIKNEIFDKQVSREGLIVPSGPCHWQRGAEILSITCGVEADCSCVLRHVLGGGAGAQPGRPAARALHPAAAHPAGQGESLHLSMEANECLLLPGDLLTDSWSCAQTCVMLFSGSAAVQDAVEVDGEQRL